MQLPRPRSLSSLLVVGLLLLVVPLAGALVQATIQLRQLAQQTDQLVRQGVQLTGQTQTLFRFLRDYERSSNLFILLGDPTFMESSRATQQQIAAAADNLAVLPMDDRGVELLEALKSASLGVLAVLEFGGPESPDRAQRLSQRLEEVNAAAGSVSVHANEVLDERLVALEDRSNATRRSLLMWLAAVVPALVALVLIFAFGVLRPLRNADRAIQELGRGTFSRPIQIKGPTDIEALGRQLEWLRVRLLELAQEKNRFLRHMSHELKTPLANIREGTDLLLDGAVGEIDPQQREVTDIMRLNALRLQQLIENLLSYSAWQAQATGLERSRFDLNSVLAPAFRAQKLTIASRRIRVNLDVENISLNADRGKLRLVIDNLLSNALKFTPEGGVITVRARRQGASIVIDFADSGPGIPAPDRERVFEAFYTGSTPQAGPLKGSGIGLSIVVEFVAAHGGQVELIEGEFPGAHFRIRMPAEAAAADSGPQPVRAHA